MTAYNVALVKTDDGYLVVDAAVDGLGDRVEQYLSIPGHATVVAPLAQALVDHAAAPRTAVTVGLDLEPGTEPYRHWGKGDTVLAPAEDGTPTAQVVQSITLREDADGRLVWAPELADAEQVWEQQVERTLALRADGTLAGQVGSATGATLEAPQQQQVRVGELHPYTWPGPLEAGDPGGGQIPRVSCRVVQLRATLGTAGSSPTTVALVVSGTPALWVTIPAGATAGVSVPGAYADVLRRDVVQAQCTAAGVGAADLVLQPVVAA